MSRFWPTQYGYRVQRKRDYAVCVSLKHQLVILSDYSTRQLHMYSLVDGSLVRSIGGLGSGKGKFKFSRGGVCVSPDGDSVLVAEWFNERLQQVRIVDGSWVRFVGRGVLGYPDYVDCNADAIAVSEIHPRCRISVLSWVDGSVRAQFGSDPAQLNLPRGLRLLADGSGLVVVDQGNDRLCVFTLGGELVKTMGGMDQGLQYPSDVLERARDGCLIVANTYGSNLIGFSRDGAKTWRFGRRGCGPREFNMPNALAALPEGGLVVLEWEGGRFQVFHGLDLRKAWITACVAVARHGDA